jgi:predicted Zn-dependent peptidase
MVKPNLVTLKSGMKLVTVDMPSLNSVTVLAMVGVGSRYEDRDKAGISHFLEHLPFKGTANYATSMDLAVAIDGVGGKHNAFTSKEYTGYWVKVGADKLELALDVVSDLVLTARLREEDIEKERGVIIEEINMYEDQPQAKVGEVFEELVYEGSPLSRPVIGYKETVAAMRRQDFVAHQEKWYGPEQIVLGIVGRISNKEYRIENLVEEYFAKGERGKGGREAEIRDKKYEIRNTKRIRVVKKKTEQAHYVLGYPSIGRFDPRRYVLGILATLTGGNSSSRMFNEIREKRGLAYYAYASADLNRDVGSFYAFGGVKLDRAVEAVKVTMEELAKIAAGAIDEVEVDRAREYVIGKVQLDLEDSSRLAEMMVQKALFEGKVESVEAMLAKYKAVTLDEVKALAAELLVPERMNLAVIGPYKEGDFKV